MNDNTATDIPFRGFYSRNQRIRHVRKHWSNTELLHQTVTNPNIIVKGTHSYYSDCWDNGFERSVVRYLHGDAVSRQWQPLGDIDRLLIGDYVCIAAEAVILMGGNHTHRIDWLSLYPFMATIKQAYRPKGDTRLGDGCWIGMRAMLMPGISIGEGRSSPPAAWWPAMLSLMPSSAVIRRGLSVGGSRRRSSRGCLPCASMTCRRRTLR